MTEISSGSVPDANSPGFWPGVVAYPVGVPRSWGARPFAPVSFLFPIGLSSAARPLLRMRTPGLQRVDPQQRTGNTGLPRAKAAGGAAIMPDQNPVIQRTAPVERRVDAIQQALDERGMNATDAVEELTELA